MQSRKACGFTTRIQFWHDLMKMFDTARLLLQLNDDRSLLIERVIDAIVSLERLTIISRAVFPTSIYLEEVSNHKTFKISVASGSDYKSTCSFTSRTKATVPWPG
jgi:hypothetical protein